MSEYDPNQQTPPGRGGQAYPGMTPPLQQQQPPPPLRGPVEAPSLVRLAVNLSFVLVALALIGVIVGFAQRDAEIEAAQNANTGGLTQGQIEAVVNGGLVVGTVITVILSALFVWFAIRARSGANWARVTMTVLLAIWLVVTLLNFVGTAPALSKVIAAIQTILQIAVLVLLWQRPSSQFFTAASAPAASVPRA